MKIQCTCGQPIEVNDESSVQSFNCPSCGRKLTVPIMPVILNVNDKVLMSMAYYIFLPLGGIIGYILSYFAQPLPLRFFWSLGDYTTNFQKVLFSDGSTQGNSVMFTSWICGIIGIILFGVIGVALSSYNKK